MFHRKVLLRCKSIANLQTTQNSFSGQEAYQIQDIAACQIISCNKSLRNFERCHFWRLLILNTHKIRSFKNQFFQIFSFQTTSCLLFLRTLSFGRLFCFKMRVGILTRLMQVDSITKDTWSASAKILQKQVLHNHCACLFLRKGQIRPVNL